MKNSTTEEKVLVIADGHLSLSRICKIYQAKFDVKIPLDTVAEICQSHGIDTPRREPPKDYFERQYPDKYTFYFIGRKLWKDVRNIWGDEAAIALKDKLSAKTLRYLEPQFAAYTDASIKSRKDIDFETSSQSILEWEHAYSIDTVIEQYLTAFEDEFWDNPKPQFGKEHKLYTKEYQALKQKEFEEKAIALSLEEFPDRRKAFEYFRDFWTAVLHNRGEKYANALRWHFGHYIGERVESYYANSEADLRMFLFYLEGFKNRHPYKCDLYSGNQHLKTALHYKFEGLFLRYHWEEVRTMIAMGAGVAGITGDLASWSKG